MTLPYPHPNLVFGFGVGGLHHPHADTVAAGFEDSSVSNVRSYDSAAKPDIFEDPYSSAGSYQGLDS